MAQLEFQGPVSGKNILTAIELVHITGLTPWRNGFRAFTSVMQATVWADLKVNPEIDLHQNGGESK